MGLIIAFPALVSSGLTKEPTIDADKVLQQMQRDSQAKDANDAAALAASAAASPASAASGAEGSTPPATSESDQKDDPMKGLTDAIKEDQNKKK